MTELIKNLEEFVLTRCYHDLQRLMLELNADLNYGLNIRLIEIFDWNPEYAEECLMRPKKFIEAFEEAIRRCQPRLLLVHDLPDRLRIKLRVHARFGSLPLTPWTFFERIPTASSLGRLLSIRGTVIRTGAVKMQEFSKEWECSRCKTRQTTFADDFQYGIVPKPMICIGSVDEVACKNVKFAEVLSNTANNKGDGTHVDYQEIKIQELTSVLDIGAVPRSILAVLRHELVDRCRAGDDVIVTGILGCRSRPNFRADSSKLDGELFLQTTSLQSTVSIYENNQASSSSSSSSSSSDQSASTNEMSEQFRKFWSQSGWSEGRCRSTIVNSFCPQLHGMFLIKLATLMTIIGGCNGSDEAADHLHDHNNKESSGARKSRKEGHLLLVGDPGTGKSQFLVNSARLINRSVMTTGSGSTTAGLTCAAVKDGHDWQLEAGALVMADRGVCCIDEFNALKPQDRTAIHEAMEQQTLSVAKAGLVCKLNTRCSIIAACNVKGEIEEGRAISANLALASPLLSRFDLIFLILDRQQRPEDWDAELCDRLLQRGGGPHQHQRTSSNDLWDFERLKSYVNHVRNRMNPKMTPIAELVLSKYYQLQRRSDSLRAARTTVRLLESLVRLAQAHAKLMFREKVMLADAMNAIILMEASLTSTQTLEQKINIQSSELVGEEFEKWYAEIEREMLFKLEINKNNLIEEEEEELENSVINENEVDNLLNICMMTEDEKTMMTFDSSFNI